MYIGSRFPVFDTHPTPVNVSIRPENVSSKTKNTEKSAANNKAATQSGSILQDRLIDGDATNPESRQSRCSCCVVS